MTSDAGLLARYAPALCYDSQEAFFADDAAEMAVNPGNRLLSMAGDGRPPSVVAAATPSAGQERLRLELLDAGVYHDAAQTTVADSDRLGIAGRDYREQYSVLRSAHPQLRNHLYGHARRDRDGALWLQYWFFYFYNDYHLAFDIGLHEGDWEMIQLRLDGEIPDVAVYAQHTYAELRPWDQVTRLPGFPDTPLVYPGRGSHASYFRSGVYSTEAWIDIADGRRGPKRLALTVIDDATGWVRWPGRWGDTDAGVAKVDQPSPPGPAQHGQWHEPAVLLDTAKTRPPTRAERPLAPPETSVERRDGRLDVGYDLRHLAHEPPVTIIVTINSRDEPDVAPRSFTFSVDGDHGHIRTGVVIDPHRHYDIHVSSTDASRRPSASTLTILAPRIQGGVLASLRRALGKLVDRLTHRGSAPPGP